MKRGIAVLLLALLLILTGCEAQEPVTTGWVSGENGHKFYYNTRGIPVTGWQEIDGTTCHFGADGTLSSGWVEEEGKTYYLRTDGTPVTGWQELNGKQHYFRADGSMVIGWLYDGGTQYYFLEDGALATGLVTVNGQQQLFSEDGRMHTGYVDADGNPCHPSAPGATLSNWVDLQDHTYYLHDDGSLQTGWMTDGGKEYYFHPDGTMATGETEIDGQIYHFSPHGVRVILVNPQHSLPEGYEVELTQYDSLFSIGTECYDALMQMMDDCRAAGFQPTLVSAYRTQISQEWLFENRIQRWMEEGNYSREEATKLAATSVAIPGTSEHQLGLAVDLVDDSNHSLTEVQETTPAQQWFMANCWDYGFILRYPTDSSHITGIVYEPWHYRYVGKEISTELRELGITLEEYLGAA